MSAARAATRWAGASSPKSPARGCASPSTAGARRWKWSPPRTWASAGRRSVVEWLEYPCYSSPGRAGMYPFPLAAGDSDRTAQIDRGDLIVPRTPGLGVTVDETRDRALPLDPRALVATSAPIRPPRPAPSPAITASNGGTRAPGRFGLLTDLLSRANGDGAWTSCRAINLAGRPGAGDGRVYEPTVPVWRSEPCERFTFWRTGTVPWHPCRGVESRIA